MKFRKNNQHGLVPLRDMMNQLMNESFIFPGWNDPFFDDVFEGHPLQTIRVDVEETDKNFLVTAELPGVDPDNIDLNISDNRLTLSAQIGGEKEEKGKQYIRRERHYGTVQRSFDFSHRPIDAEKATADFKNGMLEITLPKKGDQQEKGKKIPINA